MVWAGSRTHATDCQKVPLISVRLANVTYPGEGVCEVDSLTTPWGTETLDPTCNHLSPLDPITTPEVTQACVWFLARGKRQTDTWEKENTETHLSLKLQDKCKVKISISL